MRFATYTTDGIQYYGAVTLDGMIPLSPDFPDWTTLRDVVAADGFGTLAIRAMDMDARHAFDAIRWDIPVPNPEKIICIGVNFPERNAEDKDGQDAPPNMSLFPRFARSFVGHDTLLTRPPETPQLDYEGEIAVIIGKGGRRIPQAAALHHISALTLCNEGTLRDWVQHAKFNVTQGKNWDGSGAMGPWLVPFDGPDQILDINLETRVNGETRQQDRTSRMLFPVARQIEYISTFTTLVPGDIIVTGTPTWAGAWHNPPKWLVPGDEIEIEAEGIGILRNGVQDE